MTATLTPQPPTVRRPTSQVVHSTVGFGDISPVSGLAQCAVCLHILITLLVLGAALQAPEETKAKED